MIRALAVFDPDFRWCNVWILGSFEIRMPQYFLNFIFVKCVPSVVECVCVVVRWFHSVWCFRLRALVQHIARIAGLIYFGSRVVVKGCRFCSLLWYCVWKCFGSSLCVQRVAVWFRIFVFFNAFAMLCGDVLHMVYRLRPVLFLVVRDCLSRWLESVFFICMFCGHYASTFFIVRSFMLQAFNFWFFLVWFCYSNTFLM